LFAGGDGGTVTLPSGWTSDFNQFQTVSSRIILAHKTTAADTSAVFSWSGAGTAAAYFFEVTGSHTLDASSTGGVANSYAITMPAITVSANSVVFAAACFTGTNTSVAYFGASPTISPMWKQFFAGTTSNGGRVITGHVSTVAAVAGSITPTDDQYPEWPFARQWWRGLRVVLNFVTGQNASHNNSFKSDNRTATLHGGINIR
jgi:hypothetical protein